MLAVGAAFPPSEGIRHDLREAQHVLESPGGPKPCSSPNILKGWGQALLLGAPAPVLTSRLGSQLQLGCKHGVEFTLGSLTYMENKRVHFQRTHPTSNSYVGMGGNTLRGAHLSAQTTEQWQGNETHRAA